MANTDFTQFKFWCSELYSLLSTPSGVKPKVQELKKYDKLLNSNKEKTEEELEYIQKIADKIAYLKTEPLSKTTINAIIRQYGWKVYNKKVASLDNPLSYMKKGTDMEEEAVALLSKIDKNTFKLETETVENGYIIGKADVVTSNKIIDTKISWNVNSFLNARTKFLDKKYWYQMQGYMELYDKPQAEVVFLLLNTPPELIEREKVKIQSKFIIGEIDRDKFEMDMENIESAFTYSSIPLKRRYFRYRVNREPSIFDKIYKKIDNARVWMQQFEKDMKTNIFVVESDKYISGTEEDDT